jgi:hypothetical protein
LISQTMLAEISPMPAVATSPSTRASAARS